MYRCAIAVVFAFYLWDLVAAQDHCRPRHCKDLKSYKVTKQHIQSGPHTIYPDIPGLTSLHVSCNGEWIIIQRRLNGTLNFTRTWSEYKRFFGQNGDNTTELWLGNENINKLLHIYNGTAIMRIELDAWDGEFWIVTAYNVTMDNEAGKYALHWSDALIGVGSSRMEDDLNYHKSQPFQTFDNFESPCVQTYRGGWWYGQTECVKMFLNGEYINEDIVSDKSIMSSSFKSTRTLKPSGAARRVNC